MLGIVPRCSTYGYAIINTIKEETQGRVELKEGSFYPVIYRLQDAGAIESIRSSLEESVASTIGFCRRKDHFLLGYGQRGTIT